MKIRRCSYTRKLFFQKIENTQTMKNEKFPNNLLYMHAMLHPHFAENFYKLLYELKNWNFIPACVCICVWLNLNNVTVYLVHYLFSWQHTQQTYFGLKRYGLMMKYELQKEHTVEKMRMEPLGKVHFM